MGGGEGGGGGGRGGGGGESPIPLEGKRVRLVDVSALLSGRRGCVIPFSVFVEKAVGSVLAHRRSPTSELSD